MYILLMTLVMHFDVTATTTVSQASYTSRATCEEAAKEWREANAGTIFTVSATAVCTKQ